MKVSDVLLTGTGTFIRYKNKKEATASFFSGIGNQVAKMKPAKPKARQDLQQKVV